MPRGSGVTVGFRTAGCLVVAAAPLSLRRILFATENEGPMAGIDVEKLLEDMEKRYMKVARSKPNGVDTPDDAKPVPDDAKPDDAKPIGACSTRASVTDPRILDS